MNWLWLWDLSALVETHWITCCGSKWLLTFVDFQRLICRGNGKGALVVVGGAQEAMQTKPGSHDLVLSKRKGFFRVALNHGCRLVPVSQYRK